jgi:hypothetical protein
LTLALLCGGAARAQEMPGGLAVYQELRKFDLSGGTAVAENVVLKRDRGEITFTNGTFYFEAPVAGKVRGAVFIGNGQFRASVPPSDFEKHHVRRMLNAEVVESDFKTAVLRFTDDTFNLIGPGATPGAASGEAADLVREFDGRFLKETGANLSSRLAISIANREVPGFFLAQFDKGKRGRFTFLLDYQGRIPTTSFGVNGGEKGLIFQYRSVAIGGNDVWMAFYAEADYRRGMVSYSDAFDLVATNHYEMRVDLRDPGKRMTVEARMMLRSLSEGIWAVPFAVSEDLPEFDSMRQKKGMKLKTARLADGPPLDAVQEDWEGGFTLFLPAARKRGEEFAVVVELEGDFLLESSEAGPTVALGEYVLVPDCYYPYINGQWYPRHGYLRRSTFDITYLHHKRFRVAGNGVRTEEGKAEDTRDDYSTRWKLEKPVSLVTFALGPFERHEEILKDRGLNIPVEFHSLPGGLIAIKEDFIVAEMMNAMNYFSAIFGAYPYPRLSGVFHPMRFGQGFATLLLIPNTDRSTKYTFSFIAHETAHQWWGNIVAWRSYRDQWLSEGFAEYSGVLYTNLRDKPKAGRELLNEMRRSLKDPPRTLTGVGRGKLTDVGPIILGSRLITRETLGAYQTLIYNKGGLVLRMLHFLFTDPTSGDGQAFFDMMSDFVKRYHDRWATTENFVAVANEHFVRTPLARKYGLRDLNWFFQQWVYETHLPSYKMVYSMADQGDGSVMIKGNVLQENAPDEWFMPLPLVFQFEGGQGARGTVHAMGKQTPFEIRLPQRPRKVELDPDGWVLSEKTETQGR